MLVPQLAGDQPLNVSAADAEAIAAAVATATERADLPKVALAAISYAGGPAMLAALRPGTAERVAVVMIIGGYYDITSAITYLTTGRYRAAPGEPWRTGPVHEPARWRFLSANAPRVGPPDAAVLEQIARRKLRRPEAGVADLVGQLGADGRAVWRLLDNEDPAQVPALIEALPTGIRDQIRSLDLSSRDFAKLEADLLLIHGRDDPLVPFTESVDLAAAVPDDRARLYLLDELYHVELDSPPLGDMATMLRAAYRLLTWRDRLPEPAPP